MGKHVKIEEVGNVYGKWTVLSEAFQQPQSRNWFWNCVCDCGREDAISGSNLRCGRSTQCNSCHARERGRRGLYTQSKGQPVYFIQCGDYIKIGSSNHIELRLRALESSNPYPLRLLDTDQDEEFWHNTFKHRHHRGEWYYFPSGDTCEVVDL